MKYRQYTLSCGHIETVGWLQTNAPLKRGQRLTTKDHGPNKLWTIKRVGRVERMDPPNTRWQVGGLF